VFDSSVGRAPIQFQLGSSQVIPGFSQGIVGMKVGGKRRFTIPPSLAYGSAGRPPTIPGNSTLVFEVDLVSIP
jgi:FKBP-type peptidyl-prolyl cis-trans isomerase